MSLPGVVPKEEHEAMKAICAKLSAAADRCNADRVALERRCESVAEELLTIADLLLRVGHMRTANRLTVLHERLACPTSEGKEEKDRSSPVPLGRDA